MFFTFFDKIPMIWVKIIIALIFAAIIIWICRLPRKYILGNRLLTISGLFYRVRIPVSEITAIEPISTARAMFHPGSMYCADPQKALVLTRKKGRPLVISPSDHGRFIALLKGDPS